MKRFSFNLTPKRQIGSLDRDFWDRGMFVVGIDEVGRGSLSGPVTASAVLLNPKEIPPGVNDSKQLREKQRNELFIQIVKQCLGFAIHHVHPKRIDEIGIRRATLQAMKGAVLSLFNKCKELLGDGITTIVLVDGIDTVPLGAGFTQRAVIKGDTKSLSVAAASILAKVARDNLMKNADPNYPRYDWKHNVGYGTRRHIQAIKKHGLTPLHRRTFCEAWISV